MTKKWNFTKIPPAWLDRFPDGDYTVGRGADPRSATERAADPDGSAAQGQREQEHAKLKTKMAKRPRVAPLPAAE